ACLVRFESSSVPTTLPTAYDVYPLDGRHDGGYYTVKDCVTIDVLPRTPGNNVYVGFMVWSNFTATKCRGLVSLNQVIKEIGRASCRERVYSWVVGGSLEINRESRQIRERG